MKTSSSSEQTRSNRIPKPGAALPKAFHPKASLPVTPTVAPPPLPLEAELLPQLPARPDDMRPLSAAEAAALALSPPQRLAIEHLTAGYSLIATANAAGVTRMTLYRWMNRDAHFQAAYNAWQLDALTAARTRLLSAADDAVTTVVNAVRTDPRIALTVLKSLGALDRPAPGSTDPEEVQQRMDIDRDQAHAKLGEAALFASLRGLGRDLNSLSPTQPKPFEGSRSISG